MLIIVHSAYLGTRFQLPQTLCLLQRRVARIVHKSGRTHHRLPDTTAPTPIPGRGRLLTPGLLPEYLPATGAELSFLLASRRMIAHVSRKYHLHGAYAAVI